MSNDRNRARLYYLFNPSPQPQRTSWLARLPAGIFAISLGLFGLLAAWRRAAAQGWQLAADVAQWLMWPALGVWAVSLVLYLIKCKRHTGAVVGEHRHPVQGSLQAAAPLSVLLAVVLFQQPRQGIWLALALLALAVVFVIAARVVAQLLGGKMPANAVTPAMYLPIVGGGLIGAMTMAALRYQSAAAVLFGVGLAGWALLELRVLDRLFEGPMPEPLRPTIGVEIAPPAIATLTAALIWPDLPGDVLAIGIGIALAVLLAVLARYRWWGQTPFGIGFWSFSFPLAALANVTLEAGQRSGWPAWIGQAALLAASAVIVWLTLRTLVLLARGRFLPAQ